MFVESPRFPDRFLIGSSFGPEFNTSVIQSGVGEINEFRISNRSDSRRVFAVGIANDDDKDMEELLNWFYTMVGRFNGFRVQDPSDHQSSPIFTPPTALDQLLSVGVTTDTIQLSKLRQIGSYRNRYTVKKPVVDTTLMAIDGVELGSTGFSVDTTTGIVTLFDSSIVVTGITLGNPTQITFTGDALIPGQTALFAGIVGTTQMNGNRYLVTVGGAGTATLDLDSSAFTPYTSGGTGETLAAAVEARNINNITQGSTTLVETTVSNNFSIGDFIYLDGIVGTTQLNGDYYEVLSKPISNVVELAVDSSLMGVYVSGGIVYRGGDVTGGYVYDVPVRFDTDSLEALTFDNTVTTEISSLPLIEDPNA